MRHQEPEFQAIPIHPSALRILLAEGPAFAAIMYYKSSRQLVYWVKTMTANVDEDPEILLNSLAAK